MSRVNKKVKNTVKAQMKPAEIVRNVRLGRRTGIKNYNTPIAQKQEKKYKTRNTVERQKNTQIKLDVDTSNIIRGRRRRKRINYAE
jgi:hypothetical protein